MCEHYIARGLCIDFPDWSIATAGSEASVKIGYDYGRFVTGEEQQIGPDLIEEVVCTESDQVVPDPQEERSMVATSAEVYIYLFFGLRLFKYHSLFNGSFLCFAVIQSTICHVICLLVGTRGARA